MRILLLEDSATDAELIQVAMRRGGLDAEYVRVQSQEDFSKALRNERFDLIFSDYSLPSFDGISALALARDLAPDIPFIFVSGALGEELAIEMLKQGATDYVLKTGLSRLPPAVRRAMRELEGRRARKQAQDEIMRLNAELQKRVEESQQANRMKDDFLGVLSHELRTPLTAIFGWTRLLQTGKLNTDETLRAIQIIEKNTRIQMQLVNDLLDISRIISGRFQLELRPIELVPVIESGIQVVMPFAEARGINVHAVLARTPCLVSGDPDRLQQVMWNLLSNAVKFSAPKTGRVEVRLERNENQARIFVIDNGKGIHPDFMPHIFERFTQGDSTSTRAQGGLGLGLAIVRHTIELHGGTVHAESAGVGHGATFCVTLPLARASTSHATHPAAEAPMSMRLDGLRVLLVEDEADTRDYLVKVLKDNGASVQATDNVQDALRLIRESTPDVVVSDIGLPGEDGYSLAQRIRELASASGKLLPAIALTAHARQEDRASALRAGFQLHVPKPIEPAHLVSVVANVARRER